MARLNAADQNRVRAYSEALLLVSSMSDLDSADRSRALGYIDALKKS